MVAHFVYIPGLGDKNDILRRMLLATWRLRKNVSSHLVPIDWSKGLPPQKMIKKINVFVSSLPPGDKVVLVGESAGGALAIAAGIHNTRVGGVVTLCGKNRRADTLGKAFTERYASLYETVSLSERTLGNLSELSSKKLAILYSDDDPIVRKESTVVGGVRTKVFHSRGHIRSIAFIGLFHFECIRRLF